MAAAALSPAEVRTGATSLENLNLEMNGKLTQLRAEAEMMAASWSGAAYAAFRTKMETWNADTRVLNATMSEMVNLLRTGADKHDGADADNQTSIGAVPDSAGTPILSI